MKELVNSYDDSDGASVIASTPSGSKLNFFERHFSGRRKRPAFGRKWSFFGRPELNIARECARRRGGADWEQYKNYDRALRGLPPKGLALAWDKNGRRVTVPA